MAIRMTLRIPYEVFSTNPDYMRDLFNNAQMDSYAFNTRVVRPTDEAFRVLVSKGYYPELGDQVAVSVCNEPGCPGAPWRIAHFSPARARVLALHLLEVADLVEGT